MAKTRKSIALILSFILLAAACVMPAPAAAASTVTLPGNLKTVPAQAFYGDTSLSAVVIPEGVTSIGSKAFANSSVKTLTLPASLKSIASDAFSGTKITKVNAKAGTYAYKWGRKKGYITEYRALLIGEKTFLNYNWFFGYSLDITNRNVGDVDHMAAMLKKVKGPKGGKYAVTKKTDQLYGQIKALIQSTFRDTMDQDVSLFFIATHGYSGGDGDLSMPFVGDIDSADDIEEWYGQPDLPFSDLASWLKQYVKGEVIVIIESCGAGSAIYSPSEQNSRPVLKANSGYDEKAFTEKAVAAFSAADPGLVIPEANTGAYLEEGLQPNSTGDLRIKKFYVLAAARHGEDSWGHEGGDPGNYFTDWLLEGIGTANNSPADVSPKDQYLTLNELFTYVKKYDSHAFYTSSGGPYYQHVQRYPVNSSYKMFSFK